MEISDSLVEGSDVPWVQKVVDILSFSCLSAAANQCYLQVYTLLAISAASTLYVIRCMGWNCNTSVLIVIGGKEASWSIILGLNSHKTPA